MEFMRIVIVDEDAPTFKHTRYPGTT